MEGFDNLKPVTFFPDDEFQQLHIKDDDYNDVWRLNGIEVVDGEVMVIQWPNGQEEAVNVVVKTHQQHISSNHSTEVLIPLVHNDADVYVKYDHDSKFLFKRGQIAKFQEWAVGMNDPAAVRHVAKDLANRPPATTAAFSAWLTDRHSSKCVPFLMELAADMKDVK